MPDVVAAARSVLNDWNSGKIKYCTQPPEVQDERKDSDIHVSASIVHAEAREFDVENFEAMETEILDKFNVKKDDFMEIATSGPVEFKAPKEDDEDEEDKQTIIESDTGKRGKKRKADEKEAKTKPDLAMNLEGKKERN